jgi:DNA-binding IclR family transcriptional regulator
MPGMTLTPSQACRLLGLPPGVGQRVLDTLAAAGILRCTPDGRYARAESLTRHGIRTTERYSLT